MNLSPLQLDSYFLKKVHFEVSDAYDPKKPPNVRLSDIEVDTGATPVAADRREWRVDVVVRETPSPGVNTPYSFHLHLIGQFRVHPKYPDEKVETLVWVNAVSVLYSTAREVLRSLLSQGPFGTMLLPTVSFPPPPVPSEQAPPTVAEAAPAATPPVAAAAPPTARPSRRTAKRK